LIKDQYAQQLPSADELRNFIFNSPKPVNKRDLAREFKLKGQARVLLKNIIRELMDEGSIEKDARKYYKEKGNLPETCLIEILGLDVDGELIAKPCDWKGSGEPPLVFVTTKRRSQGELLEGDEVLAKLKKINSGEYEARVIKALDDSSGKIIGVFKSYKGAGYIYPTDKKIKEDYFVPPEFSKDISNGDLVIAEQIPATRQYPKNKKPVKIIEVLGKKDDPRLISLIAIHAHSIPTDFSDEVLKEAAAMSEPELLGGRVDMRNIPLVTIDGADARDFDDAVFAEPDDRLKDDGSLKNEGGWHLIVAIADVSYYVRRKTELDKEAFERGNSSYFADRVVPMLPEKLSNDLCSLKPKVNRACLACNMWIDKDGKLLKYKFIRGLMRSEARLTYEEVEAAYFSHPCEKTSMLLEPVIKPLYKAYNILKHARELRGALEIDLPERRAIINDKGVVTDIVPRERLESHKLIEEFMVLANVAAAEALEKKNTPCMYRVHDRPSSDRLENTREFLKELGYSLPRADNIKAKNINHILQLSAKREDKELIHTLLLRTQSAAVYSPDNLGHFGLALEKYAHFTSPIRRYADLIVHRALVKAYGLGKGGLDNDEKESLNEIGQHISETERRSMLAERDVMDRFKAQYLSTNIGKEFKGKINSVTHFGMFVTLEESGADGIVPMRSLPGDYYIHDEKRHSLVGRKYGRKYVLGQAVVVRLVEADPMKGSTVFEMIDNFDGGNQKPQRRRDSRKKDFKRSEKKYKSKNKRDYKK